MQIYGNLGDLPFKCIVWVGNIIPLFAVGKILALHPNPRKLIVAPCCGCGCLAFVGPVGVSFGGGWILRDPILDGVSCELFQRIQSHFTSP